MIALAVATCVTGISAIETNAQDDPLESKYGRARGKSFSKSVNGTSVFAEMFRATGRKVQFDRRLTPRLNKYETIVWFPNRFEPPEEKTIERLEDWFSNGYGRTLIYVDRDFDSEIVYWKKAFTKAAPADREKIRRRITLIESRYESQRELDADSDHNRCSWFEITKRFPPSRCESFDGPWSSLIDAARSDIYLTSDLSVTVSGMNGSEELLSSGGQPLITRLTSWQLNGGSIIIVHNGSSLLNLPLVNSENRLLAAELIDECGYGDVKFLESDQDGPEISNSSSSNNTLWDWASHAPLCYILPHLIWLGLIFCFVYFPIFGRAKKIASQSNTDFASHIQATAKLLSQSTDRNLARQKVDHAIQTVGRLDKN